MKIPFLALVFLIFLVLTSCNDQKGKVLLTIGVANNSTSNMMLSLTGYKDFLKHDFGWEDKYFLIGHSDASQHWGIDPGNGATQQKPGAEASSSWQ